MGYLDNVGLAYLWGKVKGALTGKQDELTGLPRQAVGFDSSGAAAAVQDWSNPRLYDILCGAFFPCGAPPDSDHFDSLTDKQVEKFKAIFHQPEMFLNADGQIIVLPAPLSGI